MIEAVSDLLTHLRNTSPLMSCTTSESAGTITRSARVHHRASAAPYTYLIFFIHASIGPLTVLSGVSKEKTSDM